MGEPFHIPRFVAANDTFSCNIAEIQEGSCPFLWRVMLLGDYPRFLKHKQFSFHQLKEFIFLNLQCTPHHAMHIRAYIEAQKGINMASNEGEGPSTYYALVAISSDKKKPLKLCVGEHALIFTRCRDSKGASFALHAGKRYGFSDGEMGLHAPFVLRTSSLGMTRVHAGCNSALFFELGRSFIPSEQTLTLYFECFAQAWACDVLLFYGWEAFYVRSASVQPGHKKKDFARGFRWVVERPADGSRQVHLRVEQTLRIMKGKTCIERTTSS